MGAIEGANLQPLVAELAVSVLSLVFFLKVELIGIVRKVNGPRLLLGTYVDMLGFVIQERHWG